MENEKNNTVAVNPNTQGVQTPPPQAVPTPVQKAPPAPAPLPSNPPVQQPVAPPKSGTPLQPQAPIVKKKENKALPTEKKPKANMDKEKLIRNIVIGLTIFSLLLLIFEYSYQVFRYQDPNMRLDALRQSTIFSIITAIDNILLYVFAIWHIVLAIKSKQEMFFKISFSAFSIVTTVLVIKLFCNIIGHIFGIITYF